MCVCVHMALYVCACIYVHVQVHLKVHVHVCVCVYMTVYVCVHVCAGSLAQPTHIAVDGMVAPGHMASVLHLQTVLPTFAFPAVVPGYSTNLEARWQ